MLQLPKVIGHRGAAAYAPENTLASFREARRRGATWVETDVVLTADGVPILMHDNSLKRTTGIDRLVAETPRADLPSDVPTFEEAIACWGELGLGCNVEIKPSAGREAETTRAVVETLRRCWPSHLPQPLLSSFKDASLAAAYQTAPEFARALLIKPDGGLHFVMESPCSIEGAAAYGGAQSAYRVTRSGDGIRVQGQREGSGGTRDQCLLESRNTRRDLLRDQPLYCITSPLLISETSPG